MVKQKERRPGQKAAGSPGTKPQRDARRDAPIKTGKPSAKPVRDAGARSAPAARDRGERTAEPRAAASVAVAPERPLIVRSGERPTERVPVILESLGAGDFHLIDSGNGLKLEQYGSLSHRPAGGAGAVAALARRPCLGQCRCDLHRRYRRGRHGPLALSARSARRDLAAAIARRRFSRSLHLLSPCRRISRSRSSTGPG